MRPPPELLPFTPQGQLLGAVVILFLGVDNEEADKINPFEIIAKIAGVIGNFILAELFSPASLLVPFIDSVFCALSSMF